MSQILQRVCTNYLDLSLMCTFINLYYSIRIYTGPVQAVVLLTTCVPEVSNIATGKINVTSKFAGPY